MTYQRSRGVAAVAIVAIVSLCVAACGSSSTSSSTSSASSAAASTGATGTTGATAARTKLAACLKQHGVTLPSRPAGRRPSGGRGGYGGSGGFFGGGGEGGGAGPAGGRFSNPKFRAAFQACGGAAGFRGGRGNVRLSAAAVTKFASCVKQHGYTLPKANLTGKGPIYPVTIEKNAKFQAASKACASDLRPAGSAPGGGAAGGGGGAPPAA